MDRLILPIYTQEERDLLKAEADKHELLVASLVSQQSQWPKLDASVAAYQKLCKETYAKAMARAKAAA